MDLTSIFLFCLISLVIGAVLMILIQYYIFIKYFNQPANDPNIELQRNRSLNERYQLPDSILGSIHSQELENHFPTVAFNLIFQFLFFELRNANRVRKWFHRKLSLELDELITKTTTGKLFEKLSIRDLDLGGQFPEIRQIKILKADLHDTEGHLENVELLLDLDYHGNFHMSVDADMVLGRKGSLSIKVNHVSGLARLHFTRIPYTHWSLCFMGDPVIELDIETQFQGRLMSQSNVKSLISNQIRKAIRRKHTLPNYKLRYKPFFHHMTLDDDIDLSEIHFDGAIDVNVAELTRITYPSHITQVFCTLTMAPMPWITASKYDDRSVLCTFDIEIHKAKNQQIGIDFKQMDKYVMIDGIIPNTPAMKAKLYKGDVLISIDGKKITNISQISKIVKNLNRPVFMLRIERIVSGIIKSNRNSIVFGDVDDESYELINSISFSKTADSVQISKNVRQSSVDKLSSDSSRSNTPTNSPIKSKEDIASKLRYRGTKTTSQPADSKPVTDESTSKSTTPVKSKPKSDTTHDIDAEQTNDATQDIEYKMHTTMDCPANSFITMNDLCQFKLSQKSQYLNLNVLGRCNDETILLGYTNIPIPNVLYECSDSTLAHFIKQFKLNPPDMPDLLNHPLSSQSGFDPNLCFGDVLMSFAWTGGSSTTTTTEPAKKSKSMKLSSSAEKLTEEKSDVSIISRQHNFQRKHFQSSTQCDFCGRKIWLKDGVQCRDCSMNCHKKCIVKCQAHTICGPVDASAALNMSPAVEFKVTDADGEGEIDDFEEIEDEPKPKLDQHRQSFSEMLSQSIKRVNSVNNLAIPGIVSSLNQGTRSLPPSPQHTPRKQSLVNQSTNPFVVVIQKLDQLPNNINDITREQIVSLTESLIGWSSPDEMMSLAKTTSRTLFIEMEPNERVQVINNLLSKLRLALDSETKAHANLVASDMVTASAECKMNENNGSNLASKHTDFRTIRSSSAESTPKKTKDSESLNEITRRAFLVGQSEERVQALSVIMLHLCTGLQYAQGVANQ